MRFKRTETVASKNTNYRLKKALDETTQSIGKFSKKCWVNTRKRSVHLRVINAIKSRPQHFGLKYESSTLTNHKRWEKRALIDRPLEICHVKHLLRVPNKFDCCCRLFGWDKGRITRTVIYFFLLSLFLYFARVSFIWLLRCIFVLFVVFWPLCWPSTMGILHITIWERSLRLAGRATAFLIRWQWHRPSSTS